MAADNDLDIELFEGLRSLSESAFPKKCSYCGRVFESPEQFIRETERVPRGSGLKAGYDEEDHSIVELYRNCVCGSTLMDFFTDRRDTSERGLKRREHFGKLMAMLEARGMPADTARAELLKVMRGQRSEALEAMGMKVRGQKPAAAPY